MRAPLAVVLVTASLLVLPGAASAAIFCVHGPCASGPQTHGSLDDAVAAAGASMGRDLIEIGPGEINSNVIVPAGNEIDIVGAGRTATTVKGGGPGVLQIQEPDTTVRDLEFEIVTSTGNGLVTNGRAERIDVTGTTAGGYGFVASGGALLRDVTVTLPITNTASGATVGVTLFGSGLQVPTIENAQIEAFIGVEGTGGTSIARRVTIEAAQGARAAGDGAIVNVSDALIKVGGDFARALAVATPLGTPTTLNATHVTAIALPGASNSAGADAAAVNAGRTATLNVRNSILRGFTHDIRRDSSAGTANASVAFSDFATTFDSNTGTGTGTLSQGAGNVNVNPGFRNAGAGDYRLGAASPLIDAGESLLEGFDLRSFTRLADGDGDGVERSDLGAYERQPPRVVAAGANPISAEVGQIIRFTGSGDTPEGDAITLSWRFDDGRTAGAATERAFATPGRHTANFTVTDGAGARDSRLVTVLVREASAPELTALGLTRRVFRVGPRPTPRSAQRRRAGRGTTIRYRLDRPAAVRLTVARALPGRRVGRACRKPSRRNRGAQRCTRYRRAGVLRRHGVVGRNRVAFSGRIGRRALRPGRYRLTATASSAGGERSRPLRVRFRIVR